METKPKFKPDGALKLMDQVRQAMRYYHYAYRTEQTYSDWILRFIKFHGGKTHPKEMGKSQIESFLSHLAVNGKVSASTQRQALNAIVFLYRHILDRPIEGDIAPVRAKRLPRVLVVLTQGEVKTVLSLMNGTHRLMANLLYGAGLRLMECVRLRVQDLDFGGGLIYVRAAKGDKERATLFPRSLQGELKIHLDKVRAIHDLDIAEGHGEVYLPEALARNYPKASREFRWQYLFPSKNFSSDPRSGLWRRHHVLESGLQKGVKKAVERGGILK